MLMIRPEKVRLTEGGDTDGHNCFRGEIISLKYLGAMIEYHVALASGDGIIARQQQVAADTAAYRPGAVVTVNLPIASLRRLES
jgi:ABC-type Fe3+/spermidine/putrescine transport system ATPase subunit